MEINSNFSNKVNIFITRKLFTKSSLNDLLFFRTKKIHFVYKRPKNIQKKNMRPNFLDGVLYTFPNTFCIFFVQYSKWIFIRFVYINIQCNRTKKNQEHTKSVTATVRITIKFKSCAQIYISYIDGIRIRDSFKCHGILFCHFISIAYAGLNFVFIDFCYLFCVNTRKYGK